MELVKISQVQIGQGNVHAVDAEELWKALEVKTAFKDWIRRRLDDTMAENGVDYTLLKFAQQNQGGGGHNKIHCVITIDLAKEIAMLERSEKGKIVRKYFIECEKKLAQVFKAPTNMVEALELALEQAKQIESQNKVIADQKQVIEYQGVKIENFASIERARRSKQELSTLLNRTIRKLVEQRFNRDYGQAYNYVYGKFALLHCINEKVNMDYLKKNNEYLAECLSIATTELD